MVGLEMAVHDDADVGRPEPNPRECLVDVDRLRLVPLARVGVDRREPRVKEEQPVCMADEVAADGDRLARVARAFRGDDEAIMDAFHAGFGHVKNSQYWSGVLTKGLSETPV